MISLNRADAEYVLGVSPTHSYSALEPAPLKDGSYWLPEDVITDPANVDLMDFLADRTIPGEPTPEQTWDFGTPEVPNQEDIDAYNAAKLTWSEPVTERGTTARQVKRGRKTK
jgi:hypothetical protein